MVDVPTGAFQLRVLVNLLRFWPLNDESDATASVIVIVRTNDVEQSDADWPFRVMTMLLDKLPHEPIALCSIAHSDGANVKEPDNVPFPD